MTRVPTVRFPASRSARRLLVIPGHHLGGLVFFVSVDAGASDTVSGATSEATPGAASETVSGAAGAAVVLGGFSSVSKRRIFTSLLDFGVSIFISFGTTIMCFASMRRSQISGSLFLICSRSEEHTSELQ